MTRERDSVQAWLRRCVGSEAAELRGYRVLRGHSGSRTVLCETGAGPVVLKLYSPDSDDYSCLGPVGTARKHALALQELPALGIPAPRCLGFAADGDEAAVVIEWLEIEPLSPPDRMEAARVLARLHATRRADLSPELAELVMRSTPNRDRMGNAAGEPPLREAALQHGDYFFANLASTVHGLRVLDWDLLACGDPMWDLGFLVGADRDLSAAETEAVIAAYQEHRPVDAARLAWQRRCWEEYWRRRDRGA
jgi:aminoglycoside phosphotransferase (APT) family kinase protein